MERRKGAGQVSFFLPIVLDVHIGPHGPHLAVYLFLLVRSRLTSNFIQPFIRTTSHVVEPLSYPA